MKIRNKQKSIKRIKSTPVIFKVIYLNKPFSRPLALNKAADLLKPNELAIVLALSIKSVVDIPNIVNCHFPSLTTIAFRTLSMIPCAKVAIIDI